MKQQPTKPQPTVAQSAVWHGVQSAALAGFIGLLAATMQYLSTGNIDIHTLLTVLGGAFVGALGMVYKSISTNPQLAQAALDTAQEAIQRVEQMTPAWLNQDIQKVASQGRGSVPKPIILSSPVQQPIPQQPADYYSRYTNLPTQSVPVPPPALPPIDPARGG